jgi:hypothetical protein
MWKLVLPWLTNRPAPMCRRPSRDRKRRGFQPQANSPFDTLTVIRLDRAAPDPHLGPSERSKP